MAGAVEEPAYGSVDALAQVPLDDALDALSHRRRRSVLFGLLDHQPQDVTPGPGGDEGHAATEPSTDVELLHVHLPKLAAYGFVSWDRTADEVWKGPAFEDIRPLLVLLLEHDDELPDDWF